MGTCRSGRLQSENQRNENKIDKYLDLARELETVMEHKSGGDINCNCCAWNDPQRLEKMEIGGRAEII